MAAPHININARYQSLAELKAASPTLADGLSEAQEGVLRREQYRTVLNAGRRLVLCAAACHTETVASPQLSAQLVCYSCMLALMAQTQMQASLLFHWPLVIETCSEPASCRKSLLVPSAGLRGFQARRWCLCTGSSLGIPWFATIRW